MKISSFFTIFFFYCFTYSIIGQETVWLDAKGNQTTKEKGEYYRPSPKKIKNGYWIIHYFKSGQVQMEGFSSAKTLGEENWEGLVIYYYPNEKIKEKANYKKGKLHGIRRVFHKTGELQEQGKYKEGKREGIWKVFYKNGKIKEKGKYKNNEKTGIWKTFHKNI
jgi:antitoxin component YwqK of YwqJK toxin-antitoxin module